MKNLGKKAKDKITGITGIIVAKINYLFGCNQYGISVRVKKPGDEAKTYYFDEGRVEIIGEGVKPKSVKVKKNGGVNIDCPNN